MRMSRYQYRQNAKRRKCGRLAARARWADRGGRSGEREAPAQVCVETLTWIGDDGAAHRVAFSRLGRGQILMADGRLTTATKLAERLRKWLAVPTRKD